MMKFKDWLKEEYGKGKKWFKSLSKKRRKKIKVEYRERDISSPVINDNDEKLTSSQMVADIINRSGMWKLYEQGFRGQGIRVAGLDDDMRYHRCFEYMRGKTATANFTNMEGESNNTHGLEMASLVIGSDEETLLSPATELDLYYHFQVTHNGISNPSNLTRAFKHINAMPDDLVPHIIVMAWGVRVPAEDMTDDMHECAREIYKARQRSIIICSAGNYGIPRHFPDPHVDNRQLFPSYLESVDAVGGLTKSGQLWSLSSPGDITWSAYGEKILVAGLNNEYSVIRGTSPAAFICARDMACIFSKLLKTFTWEEIHSGYKNLLKPCVKDRHTPGKDSDTGIGQLGVWS